MPDKLFPKFEFHISRSARERYDLDQPLFSTSGKNESPDIHTIRKFADKVNQQRDLQKFPEQAVHAGEIYAIGLINTIFHRLLEIYSQEHNPNALKKADEWLSENVGKESVQSTLFQYAADFPSSNVYHQKIRTESHIDNETNLVDPNQLFLEELLMLWLSNINPALAPYHEFIDDQSLSHKTGYLKIISSLQEFYSQELPFGPHNQDIISLLKSPALASPNSITGQLDYIYKHWSDILGDYVVQLLKSQDLIKEEKKSTLTGPGPSLPADFTLLESEPERFSKDLDWMPGLVLIAKNAYVWLNQLSSKYGYHIHHLDQIPDKELDILARRGFTGLWLIGVWERSPASKKIKQLRGNTDAVASAYSLLNYAIAADLGGENALSNFRDRALNRGIRLATDMVPNHMAIDSNWVIDHPDWFISLDHSPYPSYTFDGPNLSWNENIGVYLEDHYYEHSDAAVVFKRKDWQTGEERFIYHGNDGTAMPWNDTAQLNYLNPEVREVVIQTILHVARKFSVIRFDAAMTLAKKHFQRLWFPLPGSGGSIPSRSNHSISKEMFDSAMPKEFWREVVERVAREAPDTLLLAEAFWLMEGYFVRSLGMHRVYNSAFMNMLRDESNQEYHSVIRKTVEFDPEILKRYVNFMNNPDERTAVDQFGKSDKYFGICTMLATMPGLPMFGHGQIEGFTEKYGMEYHRAYYDEVPDEELIDRHEREIFPLLKKRYLFAGCENFLLYTFFTQDGDINENVYAYSNQFGEERTLVVYNNKYDHTQGWIQSSQKYKSTRNKHDLPSETVSLGEGLNLQNKSNRYVIFRDRVTGLEYIRSNREFHERGLFVELGAYKYHVFLDFRQVVDDQKQQYYKLANYLKGKGVPDIERAKIEILYASIHRSYQALVNNEAINYLSGILSSPEKFEIDGAQSFLLGIETKYINFLNDVSELHQINHDFEELAGRIKQETASLALIASLDKVVPKNLSLKYQEVLRYLQFDNTDKYKLAILLSWIFTHILESNLYRADNSQQTSENVEEHFPNEILGGLFHEMGQDPQELSQSISLIKILTRHQNWYLRTQKDNQQTSKILQSWLEDEEVRDYLLINQHNDIQWFNKEAYQNLLWWMFTTASIQICTDEQLPEFIFQKKPGHIDQSLLEKLSQCFHTITDLQKAEAKSNYQVDLLLKAVND